MPRNGRPRDTTRIAAYARDKGWEKYYADPELYFWRKVDRGADDQCWPWKGHVPARGGGYGRLKFKGRHYRAHRMALIISSGTERRDRLACHHCDNPPCCNPAHLYWGTPLDNATDKIARGRARGRGSRTLVNGPALSQQGEER